MMPVVENPLSSWTVTLHDVRGYKIDSISVQATTVEGAAEMAQAEFSMTPSWRKVSYVTVEEA